LLPGIFLNSHSKAVLQIFVCLPELNTLAMTSEKRIIREACVENLYQAISAEKNGAERLELCMDLSVGGVSPDTGLLRSVHELCQIPVMVMVRPRGGNFVFSAEEFEQMLNDVDTYKEPGCHGIVSGILKPDNTVDVERTRLLRNRAGELDFTFHKAFDLTTDKEKALEDVIASGATRLLTSGGAESAVIGLQELNRLHYQANGRITILVAGKVTSRNLPDLMKQTDIHEFHGRKIVEVN
jgi:copper homeostasis protein